MWRGWLGRGVDGVGGYRRGRRNRLKRGGWGWGVESDLEKKENKKFGSRYTTRLLILTF